MLGVPNSLSDIERLFTYCWLSSDWFDAAIYGKAAVGWRQSQGCEGQCGLFENVQLLDPPPKLYRKSESQLARHGYGNTLP